MTNRQCQRGFTLLELVTVTVLLSILAVLGAQLILAPIQSFTDVSRRAELVDIADNALQRMSRELRNALPNSIRINVSGSRTALEFLNTTAGGRYRARVETGGGGDPLENLSTDTFDVLGGITGTIGPPGPAGRANCLSGNSDCLVIYNTGTGAGDFNAYVAESLAPNTDNIAAITAVNANQITFDNGAGWSFPFPIPPSSQQRFFVVDMPVSFVCDSSTNQLRRYEDYGILAVQPVTDAQLGGSGDLLADNVASCAFSYTGAGTRHGLVTLRVQIQDAGTSESVALLHQVHVVNVP